jgi:uncharacterized protein YegP (UPF0339 family)
VIRGPTQRASPGEFAAAVSLAESRVEVYGSNGRYWFRLVWEDGELLLLSSSYSSSEAALVDIERVREPASVFRSCMTATGDFYFKVTAANGDFLATSTMYALPVDRDDAQALALRLLRETTPVLPVVFV